MSNFTFNNKHSFEDMDCMIVDAIEYPLASEEVENETVEGRIGGLTIKTGTYKDVSLNVKMQVNSINEFEESYKEKIQYITEWLNDITDNKLIFDDNAEKCYIVKNTIVSSIVDTKKFYARFTVKFICEPFLKYVYEPITELYNGSTIYNSGSIYSSPSIELELPSEAANIQITINDKTFQVNNAKGIVKIDSDLFMCFNEEGNLRTIGEFPILNKGINEISWSGTINKFRIRNNFRFRG